MIKKVDLGQTSHHGVFGNPAPLGLLGLAVSCAALTPIAFGYGVSSKGINHHAFATVGFFLLFFGFGTHLLTGLMDFANKNIYGGTIFTTFSFNWLITGLGLLAIAFNFHLDHKIILATEIVLLFIFLFLTYGFGFFSKGLFLFLLDIDLLYIAKIIRGFAGPSPLINLMVAIFTVILGLIGLWLALAGLMNPITGKNFFKVGGPLFSAPRAKGFDFGVRRNIFEILYFYWRDNAFNEMSLSDLEKAVKEKTGTDNIVPDLFYLMEYGSLKMTLDEEDKNKIRSARLTSDGIDLYEQLILKKYEF